MFDYTPKQWARYERGETLIPLVLLMTLRKTWGIPSIDDFLFVEDYDAGKARQKIPPSKDRR